jgi:hypothetical protein
MAVSTPASHLAASAWKPGQSGNPAGRPRGSRNKLGEAFLADLYADWQANGIAVIAAVREQKPDAYLKVVASIIPHQLEIKDDIFAELSDEQLDAILAFTCNALGIADEGAAGVSDTSH